MYIPLKHRLFCCFPYSTLATLASEYGLIHLESSIILAVLIKAVPEQLFETLDIFLIVKFLYTAIIINEIIVKLFTKNT